MTRTLDPRDFTKPAKTPRDPLAVLLSARAVSAALSMERDLADEDWPYTRYPRKDWTPCR